MPTTPNISFAPESALCAKVWVEIASLLWKSPHHGQIAKISAFWCMPKGPSHCSVWLQEKQKTPKKLHIPKQVTSNTHYNALEVMELSKRREPWGDMSGCVWGGEARRLQTPQKVNLESTQYCIAYNQYYHQREATNLSQINLFDVVSPFGLYLFVKLLVLILLLLSGMNIAVITLDWSCRLGSAVQETEKWVTCCTQRGCRAAVPMFFTFVTISDSGTNPCSSTP